MDKMLLAAAMLPFAYNSQAAQDPEAVFNCACTAEAYQAVIQWMTE
ncbi:hypothetical protein P8H27_08300 [Pseudomonas sp. sp1636]|nr:hypothetical protein [Pseudomonas sp. sp1636]MDM8348903.1 hypothetical protein [Pseudomonas sp. sp1636]